MFTRPYNDESGDWRGLDSSTQVQRYAAIAQMLDSFVTGKSLLDVGCGEAVLRDWLTLDAIYTGVEPSASAIRKALERNASTKIINATSESFEAYGELFDCIVFNEVLYYLADPIGILRKYTALLRHGGVILCSIYQKPGRVPIRRRLMNFFNRKLPLSNVHCEKMVRAFMAREAWSILDDRVVTNPRTQTQWHIWLARKYP